MNEFNAIETCKNFLNDELWPLLKSNDFIKKGNTYIKQDSIDFKSISYSKGKFNSKNEVIIYFYISFTFEEIHSFFMPERHIFDKYNSSSYILQYPLWQFSTDDDIFKFGISIDTDWEAKKIKVLNLFKTILKLFDALQSPDQYLNEENFNINGASKSDIQLRNIYYIILSSKLKPQKNIKELFSKVIAEFNGHILIKEKLIEFGKQNRLI